MNEERFISGGYLSRVVFGRTFVVLEGFSSTGANMVEWWLRLGKEFYVLNCIHENAEAHLLDVSEAKLIPAAALIDCCGEIVSQFTTSATSLIMRIGMTEIKMSWEGEIGCAELDIKRTASDGNVEEAYGISLPEDLSAGSGA
jgi:hypothetical protein